MICLMQQNDKRQEIKDEKYNEEQQTKNNIYN